MIVDIVKWKPQLNTPYQMAAQPFLNTLDDESVALQIFDPPYGIGYRAGHRLTNGGKPRRMASAFGADILDTDWVSDAYRALRTGGACYLFTQWSVEPQWRQALINAGYQVRQLLVWDKMHWGMGNLQYYGSQTEFVLFATKGNHTLRWDKREGNVWRMTKLDCINYEGNYDNPTQKPQRLVEKMILFSSDPGDIVLDTFAGTGTTAAAARVTGRNFLTCDINWEQVLIASRRLVKPYTPPLFKDVV